jgi:hypothetical protein
MSGSTTTPFRVFMSRGCKVRVMLGLRTCSTPGGLTATAVLLTPHSDGEVSLDARGLLCGAYRDGTFTRKLDTAFRTYHGRQSTY